MLDSDTRRKIDTLRDILVGKIPNPQTQVEQITTGLIYKFMDDMDQESIEMGGKGSFFVGDYEKYAWKNLLDPKLSGVDRVNLYSQAIEGMYLNPSAPQLFRDIFNNAFLPFKDPSTLNMFLKEINEFNYSHSEKLGDAFEYLISIMGSQGDAGQFRTPRHIIDFIVEIIDPQKNETILDPACGTAGFLISSYKHILKSNTDEKLGDKLSAEDKKKVGENVTGYDISPDMIRLSLVNMYLHGFSTPKIDEYDTLSSEDKWNEYFDVILANPPFFSPKGGIQPHKRFGVESKKAEVLFTSYILDHLKPNGRAGIIVPEGIHFTKNKAYKNLRLSLLNSGLIADITLPHGVFKPYASVKTHILIIDKKISDARKEILFIEVKNDGFTQTDTRQPVEGEELSSSLEIFRDFIESKDNFKRVPSPAAYTVLREEILSNATFDLLGRQYDLKNREVIHKKNSTSIGEICNIEKGLSPNMKTKPGDYVLVVPAPEFKTSDHFDYSGNAVCIPLVSSSGHGKADIKRLHYVEGNFALADTMVAVFSKDETKLKTKYLHLILSGKIDDLFVPLMKGATNITLDPNDLYEITVPVLNSEDQLQFIKEVGGYQKIIDGCIQVVENYKPTIDIDPSWEMVELGEVCVMIKRGITPKYAEKDGLIVINQRCIREHSINLEESRFHNINEKKVVEEKFVKYGDVLVNSTGVGTLGRVAQYIEQNDIDLTVDSHVTIVRPKEGYFEDNFFGYVMIMIEKEIMESGIGSSGQTELSRDDLSNMKISFPKDKSKQKEIVQKIEEERKVIEGNKKLIEIYTQKIQDRINKVWGE